LPVPISRGYRCYSPSVFASLLVSPGTYVTGRYTSNPGVPLIADYIRALTESFDAKLTDVGNPLIWQRGRYADRGLAPPHIERRIHPVCDRASVCSVHIQPTNQSLSLPYLVQGNLGPSLWHDQSRPSA